MCKKVMWLRPKSMRRRVFSNIYSVSKGEKVAVERYFGDEAFVTDEASIEYWVMKDNLEEVCPRAGEDWSDSERKTVSSMLDDFTKFEATMLGRSKLALEWELYRILEAKLKNKQS